MKKYLVLSILVSMPLFLLSQSQHIYNVGDNIVGKNVKYICKAVKRIPHMVRIDNISNRDTTSKVYNTDGKVVSNPFLVADNNFREVDIHNIVKQVFSQGELAILKYNKVVLSFRYTTNNKGITNEISFYFKKNAPVLSKLNPDKFYELEKRLKIVLRLTINELYQDIRNPKWFDGIAFMDIE